MKWYGKFKLYGRFGEVSIRKTSIDIDAIPVKAAAVLHAMAVGKTSAAEMTADLAELGDDWEYEYGAIDPGEIAHQTDMSISISAEEYYGGVATTKSACETMYKLAGEQEQTADIEDWDESKIEKAIDAIVEEIGEP